MNIAEASIRYPIVTTMFILLILGGGFYAYRQLGRLEDPEFTIKDALIVTKYPGASAAEVDIEITERIESACQQLGQVRRITSMTRDGLSVVTVTIKDRYGKAQLPQVWDELRRKVNDLQPQLPPGVNPSVVNDDYGDVFGIVYSITGNGYTYKEIEDYAEDLRRELLLVTDVKRVDLYGAPKQTVYLEISRTKMANLGLSPEHIFTTLNLQNLVLPSGKVKVGEEHIRIAPTGEFNSVQEIGELQIRGPRTESLVFLKDVAQIYRGYEDPPALIVRHNGKNAVCLGISTAEGGNVVLMGNGLTKRLAELEFMRPVGMEISTVSHQADSVNAAISNFVISLWEAILIVIVVLMLFMGWRSALVISIVLLLTIFATFIWMWINGVLLERISLGALIIALGMLVDNAIVVVEGVLIGSQKGMTKIAAAASVVKQTMWPLFGATVVAILAFGPIGFSPDATGEFCKSLFQVVAYSLFLSWVLAITITPLLCYWLLPAGVSTGEDPYKGIIFTAYRSLLKFCLRFRWATVVTMGVLLALAIYGFRFVPKSFFPDSTRPQFMVHYWRPEGTHIYETESDVGKIEAWLRTQQGVKDVDSFIGRGAQRFLLTYTPEKDYSSYGLLMVGVEDYTLIDQRIADLNAYIAANFPDSEPKYEKFVLGPTKGAKIEARFMGPDPVVLRSLAEKAKQIYRSDSTAANIRDDWRQAVKVVRPVYAETEARLSGITRPALMHALQSQFSGYDVGIYRERDKLLPIRLRPPAHERSDIESIQDVQVWNPRANTMVPIRQVVSNFETITENPIIQRRYRRLMITAQCDPKIGLPSELLARVKPQIESISLPAGYTLEWGGELESSNDAQRGISNALPICVLLMIATVICLFNSVREPLIIWLTVPLAVIGMTAGLLATGQAFGFMAILGGLSLIGMLIKNAIVLLDEMNLQIREQKSPYQAVVEASVSRVRPVSMAAFTTVLGMIPLLLDVFFSAMAVTIMAGLTFATVLTLLFVPVLYVIFFNIPNEPSA
jgi:multidrug efflux pump subunit AcrB